MSCANPVIDEIPYIGCCPTIVGEAVWYGISCSLTRVYYPPPSQQWDHIDFVNAMINCVGTLGFREDSGTDVTQWGLWNNPPTVAEYFSTSTQVVFGSDSLMGPQETAHSRVWLSEEGGNVFVMEAQRLKLVVSVPEQVCIVTRRREWDGSEIEEHCEMRLVQDQLTIEAPSAYVGQNPILNEMTGRFVYIQRADTPAALLGSCANFAP